MSASNTGRTADVPHQQRSRSQVGVAPACRALGVPRASFYRRQRPAPGHQAAPSYARPGPACVRTRFTSSTCSPARAYVDKVTGRGRRERCSMKAGICAAERNDVFVILAANFSRAARAAQSAQSSLFTFKPERWWRKRPAQREHAELTDWDITRLRGPKRWTSCLPLCLASTSSAATSWAGWLPIGRTSLRSPRR